MLLENLIENYLTIFLKSNNLLHYRNLDSEKADPVRKFFSKLCLTAPLKAMKKYTSFVSLDIKGSFDNVEWGIYFFNLVY